MRRTFHISQRLLITSIKDSHVQEQCDQGSSPVPDTAQGIIARVALGSIQDELNMWDLMFHN